MTDDTLKTELARLEDMLHRRRQAIEAELAEIATKIEAIRTVMDLSARDITRESIHTLSEYSSAGRLPTIDIRHENIPIGLAARKHTHSKTRQNAPQSTQIENTSESQGTEEKSTVAQYGDQDAIVEYAVGADMPETARETVRTTIMAAIRSAGPAGLSRDQVKDAVVTLVRGNKNENRWAAGHELTLMTRRGDLIEKGGMYTFPGQSGPEPTPEPEPTNAIPPMPNTVMPRQPAIFGTCAINAVRYE